MEDCATDLPSFVVNCEVVEVFPSAGTAYVRLFCCLFVRAEEFECLFDAACSKEECQFLVFSWGVAGAVATLFVADNV